VRRNLVELREELELGLYASGRGAKLVDGFLARLGETREDGGFEGFDVLA